MAPHHGELEITKGKIHLTNGQISSEIHISGDLPVSVRQSGDGIIIRPAGIVVIDLDPVEEIPAKTERNDNSRAQYRALSHEPSIRAGSHGIRDNNDDHELEITEPKHSEVPETNPNTLTTPTTPEVSIEDLNSSTIGDDLDADHYADVVRKYPSWSKGTQDILSRSRHNSMLCEMSLLRNVPVVRARAEFRDHRLVGYLVQSRGAVNPHPCFNCQRHVGPFSGYQCVSVYNDNLKIKKGACGACVWGADYKSCSYHDDYTLRTFKGNMLKDAREAKSKTDRIKREIGRVIASDDDDDE